MTATVSSPGSRRNLLWITCDEMQAAALGMYGNRSMVGRTPAIERLADEGLLLERCFVQMPKCVPMRGQLLTGRYTHCDGLRTMSRAHFGGDRSLYLDEHSPSLVPWLSAAGYRVGLAGKNHIYHARSLEAVGLESLPMAAARPPRIAAPPDDLLKRAYYDGRVADDDDGLEHYDGQALAAAIAFIERDDPRPFCCLFDIGHPHPPYLLWPGLVDDVPDDAIPLPAVPPLEQASICDRAWRQGHDIEALDDDQRRLICRAYLSQCCHADRLIACLLARLEAVGHLDDTLIVFSSDHGDFVGAHGCWEKWDTALYDPIIHIPAILRLPGAVPAGQRRSQLCEAIDLCPTICALLGLPDQPTIHGRSLTPLFADPTAAHKDAVFCQGGVEQQAIANPGRNYEERLRYCYRGKQRTLLEQPEAILRAHAVRTDRYKLIYRLSGHHELYDLASDPEELDNRWGDPDLALVQADLQQRLLDFFVTYQNDLPVITELWA